MQFRVIVTAAMLVLPTPAAMAQQPASADRRLITALEAFVPQALRWDGAPGLTIAVGHQGKLIWERGYGWADLAKKLPMTPATITRAGSMSKTYTGTAAMQLVEQGVLGLDQPINQYLRDFKVVNPLGPRDITVRDLMTHQSGLSEADARYADLGPTQSVHDYLVSVFARADQRGSDGQYVRWMGKVGEGASYSNIGITLLGYLIEITNPEHLTFAEYVGRHIQGPLGMKRSHFPPDHAEPAEPAGLSTGYAAIGGVLLPVPRLWVPVHPAGTLYATAAEHLRLVQTFLGRGSYGNQTILQPASVDQMLTPTVPFRTGKLGLVWMWDHPGEPNAYFGHGGAYMFGWTNMGAGFPRFDVGVVVTVNRWPMETYGQNRAENLIVEFIGNWLAAEEAGAVARPARSWAWKRSYAIGMIMAYSYHGSLQATTKLSQAAIRSMAAARSVLPGPTGPDRWDPAGFEAGFRDVADIANDPAAVKAFLGSTSIKINPAELELVFADIGGRGPLP